MKKFDEAKHALLLLNIGTNHFDMYVNEKDTLDVIPLLPKIYDEPFADSSQIPTFLVSKFAKEKVTVALSGDAGDELFGGYNRYVFSKKTFNKILKTPILLRKLLSKFLLGFSEEKWNSILSGLLRKQIANIGHKVHKAANVLVLYQFVICILS